MKLKPMDHGLKANLEMVSNMEKAYTLTNNSMSNTLKFI
jgi:hypothetical protein